MEGVIRLAFNIILCICYIFIIVSITGIFFSWIIINFNKTSLPNKNQIKQELYREPQQNDIKMPSFQTERGGFTYTVKPLASYELYGLVVSYNDNEAFSDVAHKYSNDHLNTRDLCVVWGDNIKTEVYQHIKFGHGDYTCFVNWKESELEWAKKYKNENLSNNHILPANDAIYKLVRSVRNGDQIYFKGYLATYKETKWPSPRGTSLTRTDTGNGAYETVWVTDFQILSRGHIIARTIIKFGLYCMISCLILLVALYLIKPHYHEEGLYAIEHDKFDPQKISSKNQDQTPNTWQKWGI